MSDEKRIYVIVPKTIQAPGVLETLDGRIERVLNVPMPAGRLMAQCAHVVSKMRCYKNVMTGVEFSPITTIVLSVRNSKELAKTYRELSALVPTYAFCDTNEPVYGTPAEQLTALCTIPVLQSDVDDAIGHLELYAQI